MHKRFPVHAQSELLKPIRKRAHALTMHTINPCIHTEREKLEFHIPCGAGWLVWSYKATHVMHLAVHSSRTDFTCGMSL